MTCSVEDLERQLEECKKEAVADFKRKYVYGQIFKDKTDSKVAYMLVPKGSSSTDSFLVFNLPKPYVYRSALSYRDRFIHQDLDKGNSYFESITYNTISELEPVDSIYDIFKNIIKND